MSEPRSNGDPSRPGVSAVWLHWLLLGVALLVPATLFAGAAYQTRREVLAAGQDTIARTTAVMYEHARKVFETQELTLDQVNERVDGLDWDAISKPGTSVFLRRLKDRLDQVVSIWVADRDGTIRAGSQPWEAVSTGIAGRDWFERQREPGLGLYVSEPFVGRATGIASFAISERRTTADGGFDGTVHVAASPGYFERFYQQAAPKFPHVAALMRADGFLLARTPVLPELRKLRPNSALLAYMAAHPVAGSFRGASSIDGVERIWAYRKVGPFPVYVLFGVSETVLLQPWRENLWIYGSFAFVAALTLLAVSWLALTRARAEQVALQRLRQEIAQRQTAEQQLRHVQRLEAVGQLTGGIAHDFNNLLTAILGNLELIQRAAERGAPDGPGKITRLAGTAIAAVQRGSRLTKSLLAFSRSQPLQTEALDVNALIQEFQLLVRQAVGEKVEIALRLEPDLPRAWTDGAQLEAAILNLAINARDAMPGGGQIVIETARAEMGAADLIGNAEARPGHFVRIAVTDTGHGMPPEVMAKAFEPFFTTKPIGQGTGLGLSQVFGFARQLGGHVTIRSAAGSGTAVTLFLPVAEPGPAA